jgi:hypothetical protein
MCLQPTLEWYGAAGIMLIFISASCVCLMLNLIIEGFRHGSYREHRDDHA